MQHRETGAEMVDQSEPHEEDSKNHSVRMNRRSKRDLIAIFLDQLVGVRTREEAARLTELLLERYKGI